MRILRKVPGVLLLPLALGLALPAAAQVAPFIEEAEPDSDAVCRPLPRIDEVSSRGRVLRDTLTMAPGRVRIDNTVMRRNIYNDRYNAPLYRLQPGDSVNILVRNRMDSVAQAPPAKIAETNQHFHGYVVTPLPTAGDNVVPTLIPRGGENRNAFGVPRFQSQGLMWYHPHPHGSTSAQVNGGLAGAMIIGDLLQYFPDYRAAGLNERVMYIKDTKNDAGTTTVNILGNTCTRLTIRPGQMQLWRIANMSANTFVNLKLRGQRFIVLAWDGNRVMRPMPEDSLLVSPGSRVEAVVTGWRRPGPGADSVQLVSDPFRTSGTGTAKQIPLGWLVNQGVAVPETPKLPGVDAEILDSIARLVDDPDVNRETIRFQFVNNKFMLNDLQYTDPGFLSTAVPWEQTQEWTLVNETNFLHTFHIHQTDFVVTHINGVEQPDSVHLDNVFLGIHQVNGVWVGDTVVVRFKYVDIAAGPFVYHCHVLGHEDGGMMANMCVYDPATGVQYCREWFPRGPEGIPQPHAHRVAPAAEPARAEGGGGDRRR
ncbi:MAG TPA: multicopper oxidase family protein [Longimicrobiaceae bacterium]|nr:multicopper oxidase family protein [Longimicrobiaceae bacterium]